MTSSAALPSTVAEPLSAIVERARGLVQPGRRTILGITGAPGAGKSTLVDALAAQLADVAAVVGMDGFHLADAELRRLGRHARKGAPDTFDSLSYARLLARLRRRDDAVVYAPRFDRRLEDSVADAVAVRRDIPLVITEGNYLLLEDAGWAAVRRCLDQVWFLDVADDVRVKRLAGRHEQYGLDPAAALHRATAGIDHDNAVLVEQTRSRADLVLRVLPSTS